jgi:peptidoglycan/LPS O-acetylase OafA/YrhL
MRRTFLDKIITSLVPPTGGERFLALDGLRGLACLGVLAAHLPKVYPDYQIYLIGAGDVGVNLFFALSAFLLYYPCLKSGIPPSLGRYYARRFWRIVPAYLVAVGVTIIAVPMARTAAPTAIIANLLFLQNFREEWSRAVIASAWFLVPLVQFYLVFPFLARVLLPRPWVGLAVAIILAVGVQAFLIKLFPGLVYFLNWPFLALPFLCGLLAAQLIFTYRGRFSAFTLLALLLLGLHATYLRALVDTEARWLFLVMRGPLVCALCGMVIAGVLSGARGRIHSIFTGKLLRAIGVSSYGAFLFHYPLRWGLFNYWSPMACLILMIPLSLLLGALSYLYFESPLMRRITGGRPVPDRQS